MSAFSQELTEATLQALTGWRMRRAEALRGPFADCEEFRHGTTGGRICAVVGGLFFGVVLTSLAVLPWPQCLAGVFVGGLMMGVFVWSAVCASREFVRFERERIVVQGVFRRTEIADGTLHSVGGWMLRAHLSVRGGKPVSVDTGMKRGTLMLAMLLDRRRQAGEPWHGRRSGRRPDGRHAKPHE